MKPRLPFVLIVGLGLSCSSLSIAGHTDTDGVRTYTGNNNTAIDLSAVPATITSIIFDMSGDGTSNWFAGNALKSYGGDIQIGGGTNDSTQGLRINNGNQNNIAEFSGTVTGGGILSKTGAGTNNTIRFTGDVTAFTGEIQLGATDGRPFTLGFGSGQAAPVGATAEHGVSGTGTITFSTSANTLEYNYGAGSSPVYVTNAITKTAGTSKVTLSGAAAMEFTKSVAIDTLTIGNSAASVTFHEGTIGTVSGTAVGFTKTGAGSLAIGDLGGNTLTINEGSVTGTLANGTVAAGTGGTLGTSSAVFTLNGGTIDFGNVSTTASLSATGTLTLTSGNLTIGNLDALAAGTEYTLINGSSLTWGSTDFSGLLVNGLGVGTDGYFYQTIDGQKYKLHLGAQSGTNSLVLSKEAITAQTLTWSGGDGTWSVGGGSWAEGGTFSNDDEVIFSGGSGSTTITLDGALTPFSIVVAQGEYVFAGSGSIDGASLLTVGGGNGTAKLTIETANASWRGTVELQGGGSLAIGHADALGSSTINFKGGTLQYGSGIAADISGQITGTGAIRVQTSDTSVTWAADVLAAHSVEKSGAADLTLTLAGGSTYTNALTATEGKLKLNVATGTATYNGTLSVSGDGVLVKTGEGTFMTQASATLTGAKIEVLQGTFQIGHVRDTAISSAPASVTVADAAVLAFYGARATWGTELNLQGGSTLNIIDGSASTSPSDPNLTLTGKVTLGEGVVDVSSQYDKTLKISGQVTGKGQLHMTNVRDASWGGKSYIYLINANNDFSGGIQIDRQEGYIQVSSAGALGTGNIKLEHASSGFIYQGTAGDAFDTFKGGSSQIIEGKGGVQILSGNLELQGNNTYAGTTTVTAGSLKVSGSIGSSSSSNAYNVASGANLVLGGSGTIANSGVAVSARAAGTDATLSNATVTSSGIDRTAGTADTDRATVSNALVTVQSNGAFSLANVSFSNSVVDLSQAVSVTLSNVAFTGDSKIALTLGNEAGVTTSTTANLTHLFASGEMTAAASVSKTLSWTGVEAAELVLDLNNSLLYSADLAGKSSVMIWLEGLTLTDPATQLTLADHLQNGLKTDGASVAVDSYTAGSGASSASGTVVYIDFAPAAMPEPTTATLGLLGLSSLLLRRRRRV